jgi:anti-sigma B factor antagonist
MDADALPNFSISHHRAEVLDVIAIAGEFDVSTSPRLADALRRCEGDVEVDCAGLTFIDSAGLGVLVAYWRRNRETGHSYSVTNLSPECWRIFEITGLVDPLNATTNHRD